MRRILGVLAIPAVLLGGAPAGLAQGYGSPPTGYNPNTGYGGTPNPPAAGQPYPAPQPYGSGGGTPYGGAPQQPGYGRQMPPNQPNPGGRQNFAEETTDFGVQPQREMQQNVGSPTPTSIPGARVISTAEMPQAIAQGALVIDVLEGPPHPQVPGSIWMPGAGQAGSFSDQTQQQLWTALSQATQMQPDKPLVFLCLGSRCWESYNAALRAASMGFKAVYWYRGGLQAWQAAGLPMSAAGQNGTQQPGGQQPGNQQPSYQQPNAGQPNYGRQF